MDAPYAACAAASRTPYFFSVDADTWVIDGFRFEVGFEPAPDEIAIWFALNPINGLRYGHGGIKLFPTALMLSAPLDRHVDLPTAVARNRYIAACASEHRFNADPYGAWAGAFRECTKLAVSTTMGSEQSRALAQRRLAVWCTKGADAKFGAWCLRGAQEGRLYGLEHARSFESIQRINDFDWLRAQFRARHVRKIAIPPRAQT
jgi:hypothetical protein